MNEKINVAKELMGQNFSELLNVLQMILSRLKLPITAKLLDIGTGRGHMAIALALSGHTVITGEPEGANWANWRDSARKINVMDKIHFQALNAENLFFSDNEFDAVFLYGSLHHIDNKKNALNEALRVVKQGGKLVIIELTQKGVESLRTHYSDHPDAVDPRKFTENWTFPVEIIQEEHLNSYIYYKNKID
jgi:ubiquinone/menaquinone biosynthesis C-methylase UbiE